MTSEAAAIVSTPSTAPAAPLELAAQPKRDDRGSRSFGRQALIDTFSRPGARVGIIWVAFLVTIAVFAPFIANSLPVAVKTDQGWSSPVLRSLSPIDVILLVGFIAAAALLIGRFWTFGKSMLVLL